MIRNKSDFFPVEATEKRRRGDFVESPCLADGQNELREHIANVGNVGFCFRPEEVLGNETFGISDRKVDLFDDFSAVEESEVVPCHSVF